MEREIPLIKEYRIDRLNKSLECFDQFVYDRSRQRDCVLKLYDISNDKNPEHWDKSIFRGMVIPSLRQLGLIYGEGDYLKVSANGEIIIRSKNDNSDFHQRVIRAVIYEIDKRYFQFIPRLFTSTEKNNFIKRLSEDIKGISEKQRKERIDKWLSVLNQVNLIYGGSILIINESNSDQALIDLDTKNKSIDFFKQSVFKSYRELYMDNAGIVKIEEIRKRVGVIFLENSQILTEYQFDEIFRKLPFEGKNYLFSFGKPMGSQEKLFDYNGTLYNTIHIKFL